jgi:hypothetical protein
MRLTESKLNPALQSHVRELLKGKKFDVAEIDGTIKSVRETFSKFLESNVDNRGMDIRMGMEGSDKVAKGIELFFLESSNPTPLTAEERKAYGTMKGYRSFKEAYRDLTGDIEISGRRVQGRFTESLATGDWTNVVSTAMNKRVVRDYGLLQLDTWRAFSDITPLNDFKQQQRVRYGGYGNLPLVSEGGGYAPLTSPGDEKATYSPAKRGGTEDLTLEMIMNDDLKAIVSLPQRMARAAAQTLHEFVYDFIKPSVNPTIYDGVVLYHAGSHANTGTAALDATGLKAARLRMKKQAMLTSAKRIGIRAGYLLVPSDLEDTAYGLLTPAYSKNNNVPDFLQQVGITPIVVDYWTDATDWVLVARPQDVYGLEVGFVNGQETPELFVSDIPNAGSLFTNDKVTYKIRHMYGGAITDYRAFDGEIVAG